MFGNRLSITAELVLKSLLRIGTGDSKPVIGLDHVDEVGVTQTPRVATLLLDPRAQTVHSRRYN